MKAFHIEAEWAPKESYPLTENEIAAREVQRGDLVWRNPTGVLGDWKMPEIKDDEVLLKVGACGICGSDLHMLEKDADGYMLYPGHTHFPTVVGHEYAGEVVEIGKNVTSVKPGDLVAVEMMQWCGKCTACRSGMFNQCTQIDEPGLSRDGGFAEYAAVRERFCNPINEIAERLGDRQKAMEAGALIEPTGVAYNGMFVVGGGIHVGGAMAVFGAGPIGLAAIGLGLAAGAATIFAFDTVPLRRKLAKDMGADYVFDPIELAKQGLDASDVIMELTHGVGASTIVECSGATRVVWPSIVKAVAIDSNIIQLGMDAHPTSFDLVPLQRKRAHVHSSTGQSGFNIYPSIIRLMVAGRIDMFPMVTDRFSLNDIELGLKKFAAKESGKILISANYK